MPLFFIRCFLVFICFGFSLSLAAQTLYKLDSQGNLLTADAKQWVCVEDKSTGLTWEVKQLSGLQNYQFVASWATSDIYISMVNQAKLCGFDDWRLPSADDLKALSTHQGGNSLLAIDYFPLAKDHWFWTDSKVSSLSNKAWTVRSTFGLVEAKEVLEKHHIRLVRD